MIHPAQSCLVQLDGGGVVRKGGSSCLDLENYSMEDGGRITSRATGNRSKFTGTHKAEKSDTHDVMHSGRATTEILEKEMYGEHVTKNVDKMNNSLDKLADDETDGPVLNGENKRLRIRKKILTQVREHDLPSHNKDNDNVKDKLNPQSGKDAVMKLSSEEKCTFRSLGNEDEETKDMPQQLPKNFKKGKYELQNGIPINC